MTFHCGIAPNCSAIGLTPGPPHVTCDSCGAARYIREDRLMPKWMLDGRAPPRWKMTRGEDGKRVDACPRCK